MGYGIPWKRPKIGPPFLQERIWTPDPVKFIAMKVMKSGRLWFACEEIFFYSKNYLKGKVLLVFNLKLFHQTASPDAVLREGI